MVMSLNTEPSGYCPWVARLIKDPLARLPNSELFGFVGWNKFESNVGEEAMASTRPVSRSSTTAAPVKPRMACSV